VPASRSSARRFALALALLAAGLAGCPSHEVTTRPFRLDARLADGSALGSGATGQEVLTLAGAAHIVNPTTLAVTGNQDVTLTFDPSAAPDLAFPPQLEGAQVSVEVFVDPAGTGPDGEPLHYAGYRVSIGGSYEFALGEWTTENDIADPAVPPSFAFFPTTAPDLPPMSIASDWRDWEATGCGLAYYTPLFVKDDFEVVPLLRGERRAFKIAPRVEELTVLHVLSYHRTESCGGRPRSWSQIAAWRAPPASG
jgi:hypothetical protein